MIKYISDKFFQVDAVRHKYKFISIFIMISIFLNGNIYGQKLNAEQIYEKVKDAVVVILAYDYSDEPTKQGSGVVLNDKGYVVTNYHVLSGCERIEIVHGEEIIPYVDIIGIDVEKDILILKIDEKKFPSVKIGDIKKLKVGQRVYAIGSPMGFENTISEGIISGLRSYNELSKNYIQVTASISHGSSGGAVVNDNGELIGISTLTVSDGQNLNFAIPIDDVLNVEIGSYSSRNAFKDFELFRKGGDAWEKGNYNEAIEYYSLFLEIFPDNDIAYNNRGVAKLNMGDYRSALSDLNKSIELSPDDASAYTIRGTIKNKLSDYYGALQDYNIAIELNPSDPVTFYERGRNKFHLNDLVGAIKDFSAAIDLYPDYSEAYYDRAITKHRMKDIAGACLDLSKAGELGYYEAYNIIKQICN